jgi:hypothetical protein
MASQSMAHRLLGLTPMLGESLLPPDRDHGRMSCAGLAAAEPIDGGLLPTVVAA